MFQPESGTLGISYILALRNPATGAGDIALFEEQREQVLQMVEFLEVATAVTLHTR